MFKCAMCKSLFFHFYVMYWAGNYGSVIDLVPVVCVIVLSTLDSQP